MTEKADFMMRVANAQARADGKREPFDQNATDTITDRVRHIVVKVLDLTEHHIFDDQSLLRKDLAADSLDAVELMMEIEKEFEIDIADEDGHLELETIADIADFVRRVAEQQGVPLS